MIKSSFMSVWLISPSLVLTACSSTTPAACGDISYEAIGPTDIEVPVAFDIQSDEIKLIETISACYRNNPLRDIDDELIFTGIERQYGNGGIMYVRLASYNDVSFIVRYSESLEPLWFKQLVQPVR